MALDLQPKHIEIVREILARRVPDIEVRAFGSRVKGRARKYSDLDLVLMGAEPIPWKTMSGLREDFEESDLPICVDIADWAALSDTFRQIINERYEIVVPAGHSEAVGDQSRLMPSAVS